MHLMFDLHVHKRIMGINRDTQTGVNQMTNEQKLFNAMSYYVYQCTPTSKTLAAAFSLECDAKDYINYMTSKEYSSIWFELGSI